MEISRFIIIKNSHTIEFKLKEKAHKTKGEAFQREVLYLYLFSNCFLNDKQKHTLTEQ